jgi:signal transduction histidine kinase/CheY-like chemotaxis protein
MQILVDRLVVRAMLACVVAAGLMLANRWVVATQQAGVLATLLTDNARAAAGHALADRPQGARPGAEDVVSDLVGLSPHHLAAVLVAPHGPVAMQARDTAMPYRPSLADAGRSLDGAVFDAAGQPGRTHRWQLLPAAAVVELDAGDQRRLRVLVSLALARENQQSIFFQAIGSVALALALVLAVVLLILRQPRRSLAEANRYAAQLPFETLAPLPRVDAGLGAINTLRDSLNTVGELLEQQRLQHRIDEHRLQQAAHEAHAATEAKSTFLAHMSHEIRTPLNGVLGLTQLVLSTPLSERQRHHLQTAHQSASNLLEIVNEVLDLSKIDSGKLHLEAIPFSLYAMLEDACKPFGLRAADKSIELLHEISPDLPKTVIGDPMRLRQVLINLIGNAIKFTASGHVRVRVEAATPLATAGSADTARMAFHVSDTGPGIAAALQAQLFEAFTQADASTARRFGGSGLGLNICARLIGLMGSELRVDSRVGQGSTFSFELALGLPPAPSGGHVTHYRHRPGERVLWVDGSGLSAPWYRGVFASWGMAMDHATHLDDASRALRRLRYHAVFVDAPAFKGATDASLQALLDDRGAAHLCVLLGATDVLPPLLERQPSGVDLLVKPVSPQNLNRALAGDAESRRVTGPAARLDGLRLLVADDNEVNRLVASATLERLGAHVTLAVDGQDALRQLAPGRFDAVLMDLHMPQLDGFEATRRLRELERERGDPRLPVIAMTAIGPDEEAARLRDAGLDGYVGKPIQTQLLVRELRSVMARSAADAASAGTVRDGAPSTV